MCLHVAHLLSQEGHALGRQHGARWALVGQWGGADAHQSTMLVAPRVLGTRQMLGRMDAPDPGRAVPLPTGGSEDHCPQAAMGGQERHLRGHSGPEQRMHGWGVEPPSRGELGEAQAGRVWRTPGPSPKPRAPSCTPGRVPWVSEAFWAPVLDRVGGMRGQGAFGWPLGTRAWCRGLVAGPAAHVEHTVRGEVHPALLTSRQVRAKWRRIAGILGRLVAAASPYNHTTLNRPNLI